MHLNLKLLGQAEFGATTFFASGHPNELCGSNGLPLTPNSIKIYGRSQILKTIYHPHLCSYLDIIRGKHERIIVVSEFYQVSLRTAVSRGKLSDVKDVVKIAFQTLQGLAALGERGITHRNLSPTNILLNQVGNVKLFNYGLYYMTGHGADVSFPIGHPKYLAPEVYAGGPKWRTKWGPKADTWSLGLVVAELVLGRELWPDLKLPQQIRKIVSLLNCDGSILERIARENGVLEHLKELPESIQDFLNSCLTLSVTDRPTPDSLLTHPVFSEFGFELPIEWQIKQEHFPSTTLRCRNLEIPDMNVDKPDEQIKEESWFPKYPTTRQLYDGQRDYLSEKNMSEVYYLWRLAGGDVEGELRKQGLMISKPPVLSLATIVVLEGNLFGQQRDQSLLMDSTVITLPLNGLYQRLAHLPLSAYWPLVETKVEDNEEKSSYKEAMSLPLVIREKDTEYQFHRITLYERLIRGYPYTKSSIWKEAKKDIPPLYRGQVWAALLDICGDALGRYEAIDKETPTLTDRQIEVDIPRCHQYDELLSSPEGHLKFKRILKAWVVSHPQYVYWQGLDSLCAPFLYLNFNNEALAFACLSAFIPKYLHNFFLKDNSSVIQEYLVKFSHLVSFHDPVLTNHLDGIRFIPELYAIPWFLTMFSHVFPLYKILHLWDKLLLGDASFPLCIGLAVLQQLRDALLASGFNECILLFSDMPEIDIERCVCDSVDLACSTPRSVMYRQHERVQASNKLRVMPLQTSNKFHTS